MGSKHSKKQPDQPLQSGTPSTTKPQSLQSGNPSTTKSQAIQSGNPSTTKSQAMQSETLSTTKQSPQEVVPAEKKVTTDPDLIVPGLMIVSDYRHSGSKEQTVYYCHCNHEPPKPKRNNGPKRRPPTAKPQITELPEPKEKESVSSIPAPPSLPPMMLSRPSVASALSARVLAQSVVPFVRLREITIADVSPSRLNGIVRYTKVTKVYPDCSIQLAFFAREKFSGASDPRGVDCVLLGVNKLTESTFNLINYYCTNSKKSNGYNNSLILLARFGKCKDNKPRVVLFAPEHNGTSNSPPTFTFDNLETETQRKLYLDKFENTINYTIASKIDTQN